MTLEDNDDAVLLPRRHVKIMVGAFYTWKEGNKKLAYRVTKNTSPVTEMVSEEFFAGANRRFVTKYRDGVMIESNDPRLEHWIEKDPGSQVTLETANGKTKTMSPDQFLDLINQKEADMTMEPLW